MSKNFSLADIARHFSLPESTARYYCKRFAPFMVIYGEGRRKRYGEESLQVVSTIMEHMKLGKTANMVEEVLNRRFPRTMDATINEVSSEHSTFDASNLSAENNNFAPNYANTATVHEMAPYAQNNAMAENKASLQGQHMEGAAGQLLMQYLEQQSDALQSIAQSLAVLAGQKNDMQRLEDAARTSKEENTLLRKEVHVLKNLLHSSEQVHHDDLHQMRSWMSRLAKSYNNKTQMDTKNDTDDS